ncbi:DUF4365 domain-containing protein [Rhizobium sp. NXC24]|uniref:DUF4365 domain-containing protein n=1 Tax=Rhizobium sp. NXC24 TaxID=2048897 RepID=UPI000CDF4550|nr:DUF4365 domain-containing protein [Rhizobium sp. NXC24]AVA23958.1 hypothetical protein NXC24_PB00024 [Rhizobium sp. NXC24]
MKKLHRNQLAGEEGVHRFSARVLNVGIAFHPTGALDAGIDGFLELRDAETGEVRAQYIAAQLKTVDQLAEDNGETFAYRPEQRDLDYWLNSNVPVILVVIHRTSDLICWKSVQSYFQVPENTQSRKIVFDREKDSLTETTAPRLAALVAEFARPGMVVPSLRSVELLETNLLKASFPFRIQLASTDLDMTDVRKALLIKEERPPIDWIVHNGHIVSFRDLGGPLFERACDQGSVDIVETEEWFSSDDEVTKRLFVQLLNRCLGERLRERLVFDRPKKYYFFKGHLKKRDKVVYTFRDRHGDGKRAVVTQHGRKLDGTGAAYVRHAAFFPRFLEIDGEWYLAVDPTYHFTRDGLIEYEYGAERLTTIKMFETNSNVRGHLRVWRALLTEQGDLLHYEYPYLSFDPVEPLSHEFGVPDELWGSREDSDLIKARKAGQIEFDL